MAAITAAIPRPTTYATGIWGWLTTVDHKRIGILYGVSAVVFFLVGGIEAGIMRIQLSRPGNDFIDPDTFSAMFTMHGTTMIFMAVMPLGAAFFNIIIPLAIGARDVAFPRLNALSYWIFLFGALLMNAGFLVNAVPDAGWFSYANLTEKPFSVNQGLDFWAIGLLILGTSSVAAALNFIVT
ncbi:MAG: cbb3-type cytochrome c oxidase subunit I, partial [Dehalococcoidia bacterium]